MKHQLYYAAALVAVLSSCADTDMVQLNMEAPQTVADYEYLKDYGALKDYNAHASLRISAEEMEEGGMAYRIAVNNFASISPVNVFSHQKMVKASGSIDSTGIVTLRKLTDVQGITLMGGPLVWHKQQNASYLNTRLQPNVVRPEGDEGGYCLKMTNTAIGSSYTDAQVAYSFAKTPQVEPGIKYKLVMRVKGTAEGTVQCATYANGKGSRFTPAFEVTKDWTQVSMTNNISTGIKGLTSILFNLGQYVGTLYVDDIELYEVDSKGYEVSDNLNATNGNLDDAEQTAKNIAVQTDTNKSLEDVGVSELGEGYDPLATYIDKTDEEKRTLLAAEMSRYIGSAVEAGEGAMDSWIVVNEPFAADEGNAADFRWQDYLGATDYAVASFKEAAKHTSAPLYLGESDWANAAKLASLASAVEAGGARVDGFALAITDSVNATLSEGVAQAFRTLAATGKLVKISDLTVGMADSVSTDNATEEQLKAQAQRIADILKAYTDNVPQAQRGGVTWHQAVDTVKPLGLWGSDYSRKHAFAAFADGIKE